MYTQDELITIIVDALSPLEYVEKVLLSTNYLVNGRPYDMTLIIYECCKSNYLVTQQQYETLLKEVSNNINLNLLAVNAESASRFLDRRLENYITIYTKKK